VLKVKNPKSACRHTRYRWNVLLHPALVSVRGGNHNERYYSGDERGGGAVHTASKVLHSSNMATGDCRHRSKRDHRLDVSTGLWICQTSLSADLVDPAPGQMVSLAKPAKRLQGSTAKKPVKFPVRRTTCPAPILGRNLRPALFTDSRPP
jgi:hypothetical protein